MKTMKSLLVSMTPFALFVVMLAPATPAAAQGLDPGSSDALNAVLQMLTDPAQRGAAIAADPGARAADSRIRALAGSETLMGDFYGLAAQIFDELTRASGGDLAKLRDMLARAQSDSAAFVALLSPATLARLQDLATRMSDQRR